MVARAVASANETVIATVHRMVIEAKASAIEEAKKIAAEVVHAGSLDVQAKIIEHTEKMAASMKEETRIEASRLATAARDEATSLATRLANAAKDDAIVQARVEASSLATRLANAAKDEAIVQARVEATSLATAAKEEAIVQATSLATTAKEEAIAFATSAMSDARNTLSDAILDIATGQRQIMQTLNSTASAFPRTVLARLFPTQMPLSPAVTVCGTKITTKNTDGREAEFLFQYVAAANTSNPKFSSRFLKLATEVLDGRSQLLILLGDSGTGKTFTATGPGGLIPTIFGRIIEDVAHSDWTSISLEAIEYSSKSAHLLDVSMAEATAIDPRWLSSWLTEVTRKRTTQATLQNKSSTRRHTSFRLQLKRAGSSTSTDITLCDMAGYERQAGEQSTERIEIHSALLKLGDVLRAIADRRFEAFLVRGNTFTEGLRAQLVELSIGTAGLTTIVTLDLSDADRCGRMLGIVNDYLPGK